MNNDRRTYTTSFPAVFDLAKNNRPDIMQRVNPKIFRNVDRFGYYRAVYCDFFGPIITYYAKDLVTFSKMSNGAQTLFRFQLQKKYDIPMFFVEKELFEAAKDSAFDFKVDLATVKLPFESFNFILPQKTYYIGEEEIIYIDITRLNTQDGIKFIQSFDFPMNPEMVRRAKDADYIDAIQFNAMSTNGVKFSAEHHTVYDPTVALEPTDVLSYSDVALPPNENDDVNKLPMLVFNLLFAMQARPELVESGRKEGYNKKANSQIWTPNIIGRKFSYQRHSQEHQGGSKRMHWRRGHFRNQPYGHGLTEHKIIWIEPTQIGLKTYATV